MKIVGSFVTKHDSRGLVVSLGINLMRESQLPKHGRTHEKAHPCAFLVRSFTFFFVCLFEMLFYAFF
jgi:hypothetical protein